jgi:anti-sigma B factor antagonist
MAPPQEFGVTIEPGTDAVVVRVRGDLDMSHADVLTETLTEAGAVGGTVVADLSAVTFIDSSALGALVASGRTLVAAGQRLAIGDRSPVVERILEITGMAKGTDDFDVHPARDDVGTDG